MLKMNGESTWFKIKYIKHPNFCCACGMLGHVYKRCEHYDANAPDTELQYGEWITAPPVKKNAKELEKEILQARQWLLKLCEVSNWSKVKMRINFNKTHYQP